MAALPTLALGTFTNVAGATIVGTEPVLQVIASAADDSYVYSGNNNSTGTYSANFALGDTPTDFGNMDTLAVQLRYLVSATALNTCTLSVRVFQSDGTTPLTDLVQVVANVNNTTAANSSVITLTGLNTAANKAVWDGALVRIQWGLQKVMGGDSNQRRVTAAEVTGTYTAEAAPEEHTRSFTYSATGSVAFVQEEPLAETAIGSLDFQPAAARAFIDDGLGISSGPMTFSAWGKRTVAHTADQALISLFSEGDPSTAPNGWVMDHRADTNGGALRAWVGKDGSGSAATAAEHTKDIWQHNAATFTSTVERQAFLDGTGGTISTTARSDPTPAPTRLALGNRGFDTARNFGGFATQFAVWNVVLTPAQISSLAAGANPLTIEAANLQAYYPGVVIFDNGQYYVRDDSGNNRHALIENATWDADKPTVDEAPNPTTPVSASFSATGSLAFSSQLALSRTWDYSATGTTSHARTAALSRAFAYAASGSAALARSAQRFLEFVFSSTGSLTRVMTRAMSLSFSATGSLVRSSQLAFTRAWDYSASGASALAKTSTLSRALAFAASGASTLARVTALNKLFSYSGTGSTVNDYGLLLSHSSDATATGTSTFSRTLSRALAFTYAAAGTVSRALGVAKALSYAATATSTAAKAVSTSKVFGATGTAVASAQKVFLNAFSVAATGTLTFAQELAAGAQEYFRSLTAAASAAVSLATTVVYRHSSSATALATPSVVRHLSKLLQASAIGGTALERLLNGGAIENIRIFSPPITIYALADITGKVKWVDYIPVRVENTEKRGHYDDDGCFHVVALPSVGGLREWVDYMPVHAVGSGKRWKYDDDGYIPVNEV